MAGSVTTTCIDDSGQTQLFTGDFLFNLESTTKERSIERIMHYFDNQFIHDGLVLAADVDSFDSDSQLIWTGRFRRNY